MNWKILQKTMLFQGMSEKEITELLKLLQAQEKKYQKGQIILHAGDSTEQMGLVLNGSVTVESNDIWGSRTILSRVVSGGFFAETYALLENEPLLVDVCADEETTILLVNLRRIKEISKPDAMQVRLIRNLLVISAHKNLHLSSRSFHTSSKSVRSRVLAYLNSVSLRKGKTEFDIPYDRQQLADYLNVERTALSKELSRMEKDGLITFRKNHFILTDR